MLLGLFAVFVLIVCFYLLAVICEEFFIPSLDKISSKLKLSSDVAGATLMAVGSSAPEFFTSLFAVFLSEGIADVGSGTIVGSAIFNVLVIIGASAMFKTVKLNWQPVIRDTVFYVFTILLLLWAFWNGNVDLLEAGIFVAIYVLYIWVVTQWRKWFPYKDTDPIEMIEEENKKNGIARNARALLSWVIPDSIRYPKRYMATFSISILAIGVLSYVLVEAAIVLSEILHVNPTFIALTVLAAGTSVPDLISSIIVAKQGRGDMAVSNAVGSNVFNVLFGLGFPWLLVIVLRGGTVPVSSDNLFGSVILLFATVISILFLLIVRNWKIGQKSGLVLIGLYLCYVLYTFFTVA